MAVAHCSCAGYSEKGVIRAKFSCSSCKARLVQSKSPQPGKAAKLPPGSVLQLLRVVQPRKPHRSLHLNTLPSVSAQRTLSVTAVLI